MKESLEWKPLSQFPLRAIRSVPNGQRITSEGSFHLHESVRCVLGVENQLLSDWLVFFYDVILSLLFKAYVYFLSTEDYKNTNRPVSLLSPSSDFLSFSCPALFAFLSVFSFLGHFCVYRGSLDAKQVFPLIL